MIVPDNSCAWQPKGQQCRARERIEFLESAPTEQLLALVAVIEAEEVDRQQRPLVSETPDAPVSLKVAPLSGTGDARFSPRTDQEQLNVHS